jgi:hypothetical protein
LAGLSQLTRLTSVRKCECIDAVVCVHVHVMAVSEACVYVYVRIDGEIIRQKLYTTLKNYNIYVTPQHWRVPQNCLINPRGDEVRTAQLIFQDTRISNFFELAINIA